MMTHNNDDNGFDQPSLDELISLGEAAEPKTPYTPVALGGLWEGITITDEDIAQVRREMWGD